MTTGEQIKKYRKERGMTQKELATHLKVSQQLIGQYENNKKNPKIETLYKIAMALDVPYYEFLMSEERELYKVSDKMHKAAIIIVNRLHTFVTQNTSKKDDSEVLDYINMYLSFMDEAMEKVENNKNLDTKMIKSKINGNRITHLLSQLNDKGQDKAAEQLEMLIKIDEYTK